MLNKDDSRRSGVAALGSVPSTCSPWKLLQKRGKVWPVSNATPKMVGKSPGGHADSKFGWFVIAVAAFFTLSAFHHGSGGGDWVSDHSSRDSVRRLAFGDHNLVDDGSDTEGSSLKSLTGGNGAAPPSASPIAAGSHDEPIWQAPAAGGGVWEPWKAVAAAQQLGGAPVFVTCGYNKGRSGHELKDVATPFILGVMYGWEPCASWWWENKPVKMFNPAYGLRDCETYSAKDQIKKGKESLEKRLGVEKVVHIKHTMTSYDGMELDQVEELAAKVRRAAADAPPGTAIRVVLSKSTRVHMHQVYVWRLANKIPHAVFEPVRRTLQARFFYKMSRVEHTVKNVERMPEISYLDSSANCNGNTNATARCVYFSPTASDSETWPYTPEEHQPESTTTVAAHFRRGDVGGAMAAGEYSNQVFAQRLTNQLHTVLDPCDGDLRITIHTERRGADDLKKNPGLNNVTKIYHTESWEHDMSAFINADILVVTNSSMSTWAALFATGLTIMPSGMYVKHFGFNPPPPNLIPYTDTLKFPQPWLYTRGCLGSSSAGNGADSKAMLNFGAWQ